MCAILSESAILLDLSPVIEMTDEEFYRLCQANPELFIERNADGEIVIMAPEGGYTSHNSLVIGRRLDEWAENDGTGVAFGPAGGFILPNHAIRSPDAAWVRRSRLQPLTSEEKSRFLPLCPDFVVESRSPSDRLSLLQEKMGEYIDNGAVLGWLIDPQERGVYIYRPGPPVEHLREPQAITGDPELPGFRLEMGTIWEPNF